MATDGLSVEAQVDGNVTAPSGATSEESGEAQLGGLNDMFPNHPKVGPWYTLMGKAMEPWEIAPIESVAEGETRHQTPSTITQKWDSEIIVSTGMTRGGSGEFGDSDLPNH